MNRSAIALVGSLLYACSLFAQTPGQQQANSSQTSNPTLRVNTEEVNLDMVFQDKKGKSIHDIRSEEVHVYEDGVEEHLSSFKFVEGNQNQAAASSATPAAGSIPVDPMRELRFVTLVFEGLDQDGKRFFRQALQDMLNVAPEQNLYFSVMVVDQKLNMIQSFTNDRTVLMKAVDKSMMWDTPQYMKSSSEFKEQLRLTLTGGESGAQSASSGDGVTPPTINGPGNGPPSASSIQGAVNFRMARIQYDMLQQADAADREAGARGTLDALVSLIRAESKLPGRKVVLYFNPWLTIPEDIKEQYTYMISSANRANITFYTVDPKGLVTWDQAGSGRNALSDAAGQTRSLSQSGGTAMVTPEQSRAQENAENSARSNPLLWLRDLAQQTGGVSIGETNDLKAPLRTVMDEVRTYYEASYDPHVTTLDGKFHKISVKIDRPGVFVHTRSGYYALPQLKSGQQLLAFEVPLMNAISAPAPAADVPFSAAAERFNEHGPKVEYMLTIEAPLKNITFAPNADGKTAVVETPLLIIVRNSSGEIAAKFSKDNPVQVPATSITGLKEGNFVQTYRTELAPGDYTLETALMDRKGNKLGVKKSSFTVPAPNDKLGISDVVIVRRTEPMKNNQILDAFYFQGGKVIPSLDDTLKGGAGNVLPFYFVVYPDPAIKDAPKLTMGFYKDGQYLGSAEAPLPAVQADGRIPYIANLPADKFTPGSYEIHLGIAQGSASVEDKVDFKVQ